MLRNIAASWGAESAGVSPEFAIVAIPRGPGLPPGFGDEIPDFSLDDWPLVGTVFPCEFNLLMFLLLQPDIGEKHAGCFQRHVTGQEITHDEPGQHRNVGDRFARAGFVIDDFHKGFAIGRGSDKDHVRASDDRVFVRWQDHGPASVPGFFDIDDFGLAIEVRNPEIDPFHDFAGMPESFFLGGEFVEGESLAGRHGEPGGIWWFESALHHMGGMGQERVGDPALGQVETEPGLTASLVDILKACLVGANAEGVQGRG